MSVSDALKLYAQPDVSRVRFVVAVVLADC